MKQYIILILVITFFLNGCYDPPVSMEEAITQLSNPTERLTIQLETVPSEASIYGYTDSGVGSYLGKTPMTFHYSNVGYNQPWGTHMEETFKFVHKENPGPCFENCFECTMYFRCFLSKEGYESASVVRKVATNNFPCVTALEQLHGLTKTYTVMLEKGKNDKDIQPINQQQQQQQQQQQTVVIPSLGETSEASQFGTVMISSSPENCDVYIDGSFVGNTPANLKLSVGIHIVEVKKSGYQQYRREIRVFAKSETPLRVTVEKE